MLVAWLAWGGELLMMMMIRRGWGSSNWSRSFHGRQATGVWCSPLSTLSNTVYWCRVSGLVAKRPTVQTRWLPYSTSPKSCPLSCSVVPREDWSRGAKATRFRNNREGWWIEGIGRICEETGRGGYRRWGRGFAGGRRLRDTSHVLSLFESSTSEQLHAITETGCVQTDCPCKAALRQMKIWSWGRLN